MNPSDLLEQFLGTGNGQNPLNSGSIRDRLAGSGTGGFTGGAMAGGLLGLLMGNKKMRKMAGGLLSYGAAAGAGALAFRAYQNWQQGKAVGGAPVATEADLADMDLSFDPQSTPAADGSPFQLVLIQAMIGAARADGHIDAREQQNLFEQVEKMGLDAESKAFVFDALNRPVDIGVLAASARGVEQASEIYLVSRLAIDPDHPAERAYLSALAHRLKLPEELVAHLDHQIGGELA